MSKPRSWMQWLRRISQAAFLIGFVALVLATRVRESGEPEGLLRVYFDFDPLVLLATWLATHAVPAGLLFALVTVAVTLIFGRVFCGWICPLGAVNQMATWFRKRKPAGTSERQRVSPWQRAKYYLLIGLLVMAALGCHWIGVFDPLSLLYRSLATAVIPGVQYAVEQSTAYVYKNDLHVGPLHFTSVTEPFYQFCRDKVFVAPRQAFQNSTLIFAVFVLIVLLNFVRPRFWCRYVCPLGGLLGAIAKRPAMRLHTNQQLCNDCGRCNAVCPAAAQPDLPGEWLPTECFECWNCVAACNFKGLSFKFGLPLAKSDTGKVDVSKRASLAAGVGGAVALVGLRLTPTSQGRTFEPALIRPPGARGEPEFLKRCIQCGLCMKACPTGGLQPASFEAGLEGVWTPVLVPDIGYCEYNCNLCGRICPTDAIEPLPIEEKQEVKIGLAFFDTTRCLPYAYGRNCIVCEEHCPVSPKAIYVIEEDVTVRGGEVRRLRVPRVDPDRCIGCGVCEWSCVFQDKAAIRVTSANESRHSKNQPILPGLEFAPGGGEGSGGDSGGGAPYG